MQPIQRINVAAAKIEHVVSTKLNALTQTPTGTTYRDKYTLADMHRLAIAAGYMRPEWIDAISDYQPVVATEAGTVGR